MKMGFIGTGNMASAIMGGIIKNQVIPAEEIIGADLFAQRGCSESGRDRSVSKAAVLCRCDPGDPG